MKNYFFEPIQRDYHDPWVWSVPLVALLAMGIVHAGDWNQTIFFFFNRLNTITGDAVWSNLTLLGDTVIAFCVAMLWLKYRGEMVWVLLLAALLATLFTHGIKPLVDLPRPAAVLPPDSLHVIGKVLRHRSFPSGHTTTIFTLVGVIVLQNRTNLLNILLFLLACLVGISRCVVGAHWTLDILAGMAGGWMAAWLGGVWAQYWVWRPKYASWLAAIFSFYIIYLWLYPLYYPDTIVLQRIVAIGCTIAALDFWISAFRVLVAKEKS